MPVEREGYHGVYFQAGLAQIEARADAPEEAVKRLRHLLSIPAGQRISIARLKIDPVWDPIRTVRISSNCCQVPSRSDLKDSLDGRSEILRRTEAAQCLQGRGRLRGCGLV